MKKITYSLHKGFTLVELLIVIAVLGVLATVVIVAIDPLEQLARGEDAGRVSTVSQVANAMQAYATTVGSGTYPTGADEAVWYTALKDAGEVKTNVAVKVPTGKSCGGPTNINNYLSGMCYESDGTDAIIWTTLGSKNSRSKGKCATTLTPIFAWIASVNKTGIGCVTSPSTAPTAATPLN